MKLFIATLLASFSLFGCGGGGGDSPTAGGGGGGGGGGGTPSVMGTKITDPSDESKYKHYHQKPANPAEAARFLHQATFGVTEADVEALVSKGYGPWLEEQMNSRLTPSISAKAWVNRFKYASPGVPNPGNIFNLNLNRNVFFQQLGEGKDLLRQRTAFALSQIFVVSMTALPLEVEGMADYSDMLAKNAFGQYRNVLENVTLHPMMGRYLSMLGNQKENPTTGRQPDQNYAREILQLFSIGLYELKADGSLKMGSDGKAIETYTSDDVSGLAKALTGWGYNCGAVSCFSFARSDDATATPMRAYPEHHSISAKKFLITGDIPASTTPDPVGDLKIALDTIANHANVAPFISKQLIQRLVKSNPTAGYVADVADVFNDNGNGQRGNLGSVVAAILLHPEARDLPTDNYSGKIREPFIRYTNFLRTFEVKSSVAITEPGYYSFGSGFIDPTNLAQEPFKSPSVFNFYRPGYVAPRTKTAGFTVGSGASVKRPAEIQPELQITDEVTVAGYLNFMYKKLSASRGEEGMPSYTKQMAWANNPQELVAKLNLLLTANQISSSTASEIVAAVNSIPIPAPTSPPTSTNTTAIENAKKNRIRAATFLIMASPEYIVQK